MFERIIYNLTTFLLLTLGIISKLLNIRSRGLLGIIIGDILRTIGPSRRKITYENISNAFPEKSKKWVKKILKESYRNLGITLVELLALEKIHKDGVEKYIKYDNIELIDELYSKGNGLILLSGHFGNWELLAFSAGILSKADITIIVKPQKNYIADRYLNKLRILGGNSIVSMYNSARTIIKILKEGKAIALLADQSATEDKDIYVDFFGKPAATYETPAALALKFKAPIIIGFAFRQKDFSYRVRLEELKFDDLNDDTNGRIELTRRHVAKLEEAIKVNPGLWTWQHRRWKHTKPSYESKN